MPIDPEERIDLLLRDLRASRDGLSQREAERRLLSYGPNQLERRQKRSWSRGLARQLGHPLALLLVAPFPFIVWGADELRRWLLRRSERRPGPDSPLTISVANG